MLKSGKPAVKPVVRSSEREKQAKEVTVVPGITSLITASKSYATILTIRGTRNFEAKSSGGVDIYRMGDSNLVVIFKSPDYPADLIIHDKDSDRVYLLGLIPRSGPPRYYVLNLEKNTGKPGKKPPKTVAVRKADLTYRVAKPEGFAGGYESYVLDTITEIALGKTPEGFSKLSPYPDLGLRYETPALKGLTLQSVELYTSAGEKVLVFLARNDGNRTLELRENMFWEDGVLAVAFVRNMFGKEGKPYISLKPGQSTPLIIMRVREKDE